MQKLRVSRTGKLITSPIRRKAKVGGRTPKPKRVGSVGTFVNKLPENVQSLIQRQAAIARSSLDKPLDIDTISAAMSPEQFFCELYGCLVAEYAQKRSDWEPAKTFRYVMASAKRWQRIFKKQKPAIPPQEAPATQGQVK
jgi:hypothetical protein